MGEVAERYRRSMIELRAQFPAAYAGLSGKQWKAFHRLLERERPTGPQPLQPGAGRTEPDVG